MKFKTKTYEQVQIIETPHKYFQVVVVVEVVVGWGWGGGRGGGRRGGGAHIYHCWYVRIHTKKVYSRDRPSLIHILM